MTKIDRQEEARRQIDGAFEVLEHAEIGGSVTEDEVAKIARALAVF